MEKEKEQIKKYWKSRNRTYWKKDDNFLQFQSKILKEIWDFNKTWETLKIDHCFDSEKLDSLKNKTEETWLKCIREWNEERDIKNKYKIRAFAGISLLFMLLPYKEMDKLDQEFTFFQMNEINKIARYNSFERLPFEDLEPFREEDDDGPIFPPAYMQWLDNTYDKACWWACYTVYERQNNLPPVIESHAVKRKLS